MTNEHEAPQLESTSAGVFGLEAVVQDFDERDVDTLRRVSEIIRTAPRPGVYAAIALSGSAAASRFQAFPGDLDFFERVNIKAPTREEAIALLPAIMIGTIANVFDHPDLQFAEMKLGLHTFDGRRGDQSFHRGEPISWNLTDIDSRSMAVHDADGNARLIAMSEAASDPGFVKLDWVMADRERDRIVAVSKVLDPTWEAPDGTIVSLDGVLDSFYQEVYLDPDSRTHVERIIRQGEPSGLRDYVDQLEGEIKKLTNPGRENYGKIAKRLYNVFRITNRPHEATFVRSLFDDPAARLYQAESAFHALEQTLGTARLDAEVMREQIEMMVRAVEECYTRKDRQEIVAKLRSLPGLPGEQRQPAIEDIRARISDDVSDYFRERLESQGGILEYLTMIRLEAAQD